MDGKERGEKDRGERTQWRKDAREREKEKRRPLSRIESELDLRLLGIKTFETSTGQQDRLQLNHSSSRTLFHSSFSRSDMHLPPPPFLLPSLQLPHLFSALSFSLSPLRVHLDPSGPGLLPPLPIPSPSSSRIVFVSSLSLLRYRIPISRPLGFTWRALMTSRNERVPPPSNKRLFHVPMLILRESSRLQFPLHHLLFLRHLPLLVSSYLTLHPLCPYIRNRDTRENN